MNGLAKIMIVVVAVVTAASAAAILLTPPSPQERVVRRQAEAQRLIDALTQEAWNYYHEHDEFPAGDGIGSASLVKALQQPSRSGFPYLTFVDEMLTPTGDLRNPVAPRTRSCSTATTGRGGRPACGSQRTKLRPLGRARTGSTTGSTTGTRSCRPRNVVTRGNRHPQGPGPWETAQRGPGASGGPGRAFCRAGGTGFALGRREKWCIPGPNCL
jgi:hypothetical protein